MIPCHLGNHDAFHLRQPGQRSFQDQIHGALVMVSLVVPGKPYVVQQRGAFEQQPRAFPQTMQLLDTIEECQSQLGHLPGMPLIKGMRLSVFKCARYDLVMRRHLIHELHVPPDVTNPLAALSIYASLGWSWQS